MSESQQQIEINPAHSPEPWRSPWVLNVPKSEIGAYVQGAVGSSEIADYWFVLGEHPDGGPADIFHTGNGPRSEANARRIVACVNACAGIDSAVLEQLTDDDRELRAKLIRINRRIFNEQQQAELQLAELRLSIDRLYTAWLKRFDDRESLEGCLEWLKAEEQTVNVGSIDGDGDTHIESSAGWLTRLVTAMLAAPQPTRAPDNLDSHRGAWQSALRRLIELEPDADDRVHHKHELKAMQDMYADLDRLRTLARPTPASDARPVAIHLPKRPSPQAPADTIGVLWDAYTGGQMLEYGRRCIDAALTLNREPLTGLRLHHVGALERAIMTLDSESERHLRAQDYDVIFSESDASALRELRVAVLAIRPGLEAKVDHEFMRQYGLQAREAEHCAHATWSFELHGRRCPCGKLMRDFGD